MEYNGMKFLKLIRTGKWGSGVLLAALGWGAAGCAHRELFLRVPTPQVPAFLSGPAAVLLTNTSGFSAKASLQTVSLLETERLRSGQLLARGSKLLFVPGREKSSSKDVLPGGFSFIWDVATGTGYVLSEPLQAYAPISSSVQVTNLTWTPRPAATETIDGRLCSVGVAQAQLNNGSGASFEVFRAPDLQNLSLRINALTNSNPFTLTLSKARLETVRADLFAPPDGFTRYSSPEAMADELAARQRILRSGNHGVLEPAFEAPAPGMNTSPGRNQPY
jgi:hypothetical protein